MSNKAKDGTGTTFEAEIKKASARKSASLDMVYQLVLETDDPSILALGTLPADSTVTVTVRPGDAR